MTITIIREDMDAPVNVDLKRCTISFSAIIQQGETRKKGKVLINIIGRDYSEISRLLLRTKEIELDGNCRPDEFQKLKLAPSDFAIGD